MVTVTMEKSDTELWGISDMLLYAEKYFNLYGVLKKSKEFPERYNDSLYNDFKVLFEKEMEKYQLCRKKSNGHNKYELVGFLAKFFVERVGKKYFSKPLYPSNIENIKKIMNEKNIRKNDILNQQQQEIYYEEILPIYEAEQSGYYEPDPKPASYKYDIIRDYGAYTPENEALFVERTMIRALCSVMFNFDEDTLRKDFQDFFFECINPLTNEIQGDYTVLKHRLEHPEDYYYRLKGKKLKDTLLKELKAIDK